MGFLNHYFPSKPRESKKLRTTFDEEPPSYTFKKFIYENRNHILMERYTIKDFWREYNMMSSSNISSYTSKDFCLKLFRTIKV